MTSDRGALAIESMGRWHHLGGQQNGAGEGHSYGLEVWQSGDTGGVLL
jgi:hypothetical protein